MLGSQGWVQGPQESNLSSQDWILGCQGWILGCQDWILGNQEWMTDKVGTWALRSGFGSARSGS